MHKNLCLALTLKHELHVCERECIFTVSCYQPEHCSDCVCLKERRRIKYPVIREQNECIDDVIVCMKLFRKPIAPQTLVRQACLVWCLCFLKKKTWINLLLLWLKTWVVGWQILLMQDESDDESTRPLAESLLTAVSDLLFCPDFTVESHCRTTAV